jgi:DNA-binding PadR family transcriptional regulator
MKEVEREVLLAFWKVHILHHAAREPVYGLWMLEELRLHGYDVSPGTLYPLLKRLESYGWLRSHRDPAAGSKARIEYRATPKGLEVLQFLRRQVDEMHREVVLEAHPVHPEEPVAPKVGAGSGQTSQPVSRDRNTRQIGKGSATWNS